MRIKTTRYALGELAEKVRIVAQTPDLLAEYGIEKYEADNMAVALVLFANWRKGPALDTSGFPEKWLLVLREECDDAAVVQQDISRHARAADLPRILRGARELRALAGALRSHIIGGPA